jgi:hypothetical protein
MQPAVAQLRQFSGFGVNGYHESRSRRFDCRVPNVVDPLEEPLQQRKGQKTRMNTHSLSRLYDQLTPTIQLLSTL